MKIRENTVFFLLPAWRKTGCWVPKEYIKTTRINWCSDYKFSPIFKTFLVSKWVHYQKNGANKVEYIASGSQRYATLKIDGEMVEICGTLEQKRELDRGTNREEEDEMYCSAFDLLHLKHIYTRGPLTSRHVARKGLESLWNRIHTTRAAQIA